MDTTISTGDTSKIHQILVSDYFLCSILSAPVTGDYFRIIGVLLRLNKDIRRNIRDRIPASYKKLLEIMMDTSIPRNDTGDRMRATKAYQSGVLPEYIACIRSNDFLFDLEHIPIDHSRDWPKCWSRIQKLEHEVYNFDEIRLPNDINTPGPFLLANFLEFYESLFMSGTDPEWFNISYPAAHCEITVHTWSDNKINADYVYTGGVHKSHPRIPRKDADLYIYVPIIRFGASDELIREFYTTFRAPMPTTGAWDLLLFCALFDLDLATMAAGPDVNAPISGDKIDTGLDPKNGTDD